jgi:hypothetical protein
MGHTKVQEQQQVASQVVTTAAAGQFLQDLCTIAALLSFTVRCMALQLAWGLLRLAQHLQLPGR